MQKRLMILVLSTFGLAVVTGCASNKKQKKKDRQKKRQKAANDKKAADKKKAETAEADRQKMKARIEKLESELEQAHKLADRRKKLHDDLKKELSGLVDAGKLKITMRRGMLVLRIPESVLFASSKFEVTDDGEKALESVASSLDKLERHQILVAGHTDNVPVSKKSVSFKNNWELSTKRALSATKILANAGVSQKKLAAAGFGKNDPIAKNDSEEGRKKNRRVELMLVPDLSKVLDRAAKSKADLQ